MFAVVYRGEWKGAEVAVKTVPKRCGARGFPMQVGAPHAIVDARAEVDMGHMLPAHANICRMLGAYEDEQALHIVTEICTGGELFDRIIDWHHSNDDTGEPYTEKKVTPPSWHTF